MQMKPFKASDHLSQNELVKMTHDEGFNDGIEMAAQAYELAGYPGDARVIRLLKRPEPSEANKLERIEKAIRGAMNGSERRTDMTNEAKPTPGPVRVFPNDLTGHCEIVPKGAVGPVIARINPFSARSEAQGWADAHLIAEAFNVHHETDLTPRQLWENVQEKDGIIMDQGQQIFRMHEQLAELLEALEAARKYVVVSDHPASEADLKKVEAAIARAKGTTP